MSIVGDSRTDWCMQLPQKAFQSTAKRPFSINVRATNIIQGVEGREPVEGSPKWRSFNTLGGGGAPCDLWLTNSIMGSGHMGIPAPKNRQTWLKILPSRKLRMWVVIIRPPILPSHKTTYCYVTKYDKSCSNVSGPIIGENFSCTQYFERKDPKP